jgi:hypothetical protein
LLQCTQPTGDTLHLMQTRLDSLVTAAVLPAVELKQFCLIT